MLGLQEGVRSTARFWLIMLLDYSKRLVSCRCEVNFSQLHGLFLLYFLAYQSRCSDFIIPAGMSEASGGHLSIWRRARGSDSEIHATLQIKTWQFFCLIVILHCLFSL